MSNFKPHIDPKITLPETTTKAIILGFLLSTVLSSANVYLGLFAGMTVSASIPAAVLSMAILRFFKKQNILENNLVQTAASAGESVAAGVIFTFPALVIMGYWQSFNYLETMLIALCGGILGVLFTIPLRKPLIEQQKLLFPEGVATSEVLKSGEEGGGAVKFLVQGAIIGAIAKFAESGLKLWHAVSEGAVVIGKKVFLYGGINVSPALVAVGYIVGFRVALLIFLGGVLSWWIGIPILFAQGGLNLDQPLVPQGYQMWSEKIRYLGVGAMVIGGLWALVDLRGSIKYAVSSGIASFKSKVDQSTLLRTERETPMKWVIIFIGALIVPIFVIYYRMIANVPITVLMSLIMILAGFLFSAVAGYMAGLVGSSNNPISGVTIATILSASLILVALLGSGAEKGPASAILIGAVVCCAAAIAGDNMQDLKAGYILGATPIKQQLMQGVGVVAAAIVLPIVLQLLYTAYGFGPKTEANPDSLTAPQATLMESVANGVFNGGLPWDMVAIGILIGAVVIALDQNQKRKGSDFRIPVLAVAVGIYLPFELDSTILLGGIIALFVNRFVKKQNLSEAMKGQVERKGLLLASGLITGEALIGILLAIPVAIAGSTSLFKIVEDPFHMVFGLILLLVLSYWIYRSTISAKVQE